MMTEEAMFCFWLPAALGVASCVLLFMAFGGEIW